ncbi:MAG: glycogen/starch/alpha-glucan phosphorylase, partial [Halanaerobiales bacterium]
MFDSKEEFKEHFREKMRAVVGKPEEEINNNDAYRVLSELIKEKINPNFMETNKLYVRKKKKQAYYFSIEFLLGKLLLSNLINLRVLKVCEEGLKDMGFDLEELEEEEPEAGLGNGGLGRLSACFLDSLASQDFPGHGCGIRYKYGLFNQKIVEGHQVELPNYWLSDGFIWEIRRPEKAVEVRYGGDVEVDKEGDEIIVEHKNYERVKAIPYDVPIVGFDTDTVNNLRLWDAELPEDIPLQYNEGGDDRYRFLDHKRSVETIDEFLYPDDSSEQGKRLRLKQQYFLCSAGLQSIFRTFEKYDLSYAELPEKIAVHINDTHPVLVIPEMMRILMDEKGLDWEDAWEVTTSTVSYTNHTIMSEALERWPVEMFKNLLPRIYMIVVEINERFCRKLWDLYPGEFERIAQMAIIAEDQVKMAPLAIVGGHSVNGVAPLHSKILKKKQMKQYYEVYPDKFNNKTNGITHRRWLLKANRELADLITATLGEEWVYEPEKMESLVEFKDDPAFREEIKKIKLKRKQELAAMIKTETGIEVREDSIFDIHAKRFHGYKRQLMNILHVMHLYNHLKDNPDYDLYPRTFIFAGKAAPGYYMAKRVIKLINTVAGVVNNDNAIRDKLRVVFLENYSVSLAEKIIPAADVSEQISTAGKEASGTGNMKFMMNGALTLGTMDGANIQIHDHVGRDNIFIFGLNSEEVHEYYQHGGYDPELI